MRTNIARKQSESEFEVSVVERKDDPGVWTVEAIDMPNEGVIYQSFFAGPDAESRAKEYAKFKYGVQ